MVDDPMVVGGVDRDAHLLLPDDARRVVVLGGADVAAGLRHTGRTVDDEASGLQYDSAILVSPHRRAESLRAQISAADAVVRAGGALVVIDRPRFAWPDLLGRRDRLSGRRFRHGGVSTGRVVKELARVRDVTATMLLSPHDGRYRQIVNTSAPRASRRLACDALWQEANLPVAGLGRMLAAAPPRLAAAISPVVAVVAGADPAMAAYPDRVAFLGSASSGAVSLVSPGAPTRVLHPDPSWSPDGMVAAADALRDAAVDGVRVADHRRRGDQLDVEWLDGPALTGADGPRLAAALGTIHRRMVVDHRPLDEVVVAGPTPDAPRLIDDAVAPLSGAARQTLLEVDRRELVPVGWTHGDYGPRNARLRSDGVALFDLEFAQVEGACGLDIGWLLLQPGVDVATSRQAYEAAAGREVSRADVALGLAVLTQRYGAEVASARWRRKSPELLRR